MGNHSKCQHWRLCVDCIGFDEAESYAAEIARLRAELAEATLVHAIFVERSTRLLHTRMEDVITDTRRTKDELIAERDARPEISREDAAELAAYFAEKSSSFDLTGAWTRVYSALRDHASSAKNSATDGNPAGWGVAGVSPSRGEIGEPSGSEPQKVPHAEASDRALTALAAMTREETLRTFIDAGIVDEDGRLTDAYRSTIEPPQVDAGRCEECVGLGICTVWIDDMPMNEPCPDCNGTGRKGER